MDHQTVGLVGGIVGGAGGLLGAVVGTYVDLKKTKDPRQRAFMIRAAVAGWLGVAAFLLLPMPWRPLFWLVCVPSLLYFVRKRQVALNAEEARGLVR